MNFNILKKKLKEKVERNDKTFSEIELEDGCSVYIEKRNGKLSFNCTKTNFKLNPKEAQELINSVKSIL